MNKYNQQYAGDSPYSPSKPTDPQQAYLNAIGQPVGMGQNNYSGNNSLHDQLWMPDQARNEQDYQNSKRAQTLQKQRDCLNCCLAVICCIGAGIASADIKNKK